MADKGRHASWVHAFVGDNQWVKRINGQYYLYGMEAEGEVLIGTITKDGICETPERIEKKRCDVYEYGASRALILLCPSAWKDSIGSRWEQCLLYIISEISPTSYLLRQNVPERPQDMHLARKKLDLFLIRDYGYSLREIFSKMSGLRLLIDKETGMQSLSPASDEQLGFARTFNIEMEVR